MQNIQSMESVILVNLLRNKEYFGKAYRFLKVNHFSSPEYQTIFNYIVNYYKQYETKPTIKEIGLKLKNETNITENLKDSVIQHFKKMLAPDDSVINIEFLVNETEQYIKTKEATKLVLHAADKIKKGETLDDIYHLMGEVIKISLNSDLGHDYVANYLERFKYYHSKENRIASGIKILDEILGGGFQIKTLNLFVGPQHSGKTLIGSDLAARFTMLGYKVLLVTLEISELEYAKRVDADLMNIGMNSLKDKPQETLEAEFLKILGDLGVLKIKEYPNNSFSALDLENLLDLFIQKEGFAPDAVIVDYMGIMKSSKLNLNVGLYSYYKSIAEELRAIAVKRSLPIISFHQLNRSAVAAKDASAEHISDSFGILMTADVTIGIINTPQHKKSNIIQLKPIKNRNTGITDVVYTFGVDYQHMRITEVDDYGVQQLNCEYEELKQFDKPIPKISSACEFDFD